MRIHSFVTPQPSVILPRANVLSPRLPATTGYVYVTFVCPCHLCIASRSFTAGHITQSVQKRRTTHFEETLPTTDSPDQTPTLDATSPQPATPQAVSRSSTVFGILVRRVTEVLQMNLQPEKHVRQPPSAWQGFKAIILMSCTRFHNSCSSGC